MGTGSRHSKNAGTMGSENLTYAEKKALGFGTIKERLCCISWILNNSHLSIILTTNNPIFVFSSSRLNI